MTLTHWHWKCPTCGAYGDVSGTPEAEDIARMMAVKHEHPTDVWPHGDKWAAERIGEDSTP